MGSYPGTREGIEKIEALTGYYRAEKIFQGDRSDGEGTFPAVKSS